MSIDNSRAFDGYDQWKTASPDDDSETIHTRLVRPGVWMAYFGNWDAGGACVTGKTEEEAIENLRDEVAAAEEQSLDYFNRYIAGDR